MHGGRTPTGIDALAWAVRAAELGAGEFMLTSMDRDGTCDGYDLELTRAVARAVDIPVIASGGVGHPRAPRRRPDGWRGGRRARGEHLPLRHVLHRRDQGYLAAQGIPVRVVAGTPVARRAGRRRPGCHVTAGDAMSGPDPIALAGARRRRCRRAGGPHRRRAPRLLPDRHCLRRRRGAHAGGRRRARGGQGSRPGKAFAGGLRDSRGSRGRRRAGAGAALRLPAPASGPGDAVRPVPGGLDFPPPGTAGEASGLPAVATLGLRVPAWPPAARVLAGLGTRSSPPVPTRAARSPPGALDEVDPSLLARCDLALDAGPVSGLASTVVDLSRYAETGRWRVLRAGAWREAEVAARLSGPERSRRHHDDAAVLSKGRVHRPALRRRPRGRHSAADLLTSPSSPPPTTSLGLVRGAAGLCYEGSRPSRTDRIRRLKGPRRFAGGPRP